MIEAHGWLTLSYSDYDSEDEPQRRFITAFRNFMAQKYPWVLVDSYGRFTTRNGLECFAIDALHNHKGEPFYILEIFSWVASNSTGSYGLLHLYDDEDAAHNNEFQVYIVKRGQLIKAQDAFLSPYFEEVEQEYDDANPPRD